MNNLKENTTFILDKIDSLYQSHLPMLENVSEEMVRYHTIPLVSCYITGVVILLISFVMFVYFINKMSQVVGRREESPFVAGASVFVFMTFVCIIYVVINFADFIRAVSTPEIYFIMKVLGK